MLLTSQVVQTFVSKLDSAWMAVEQTFTGPVTEGQVSEVEYVCIHSTAVKLKVREWTNPKHPAFELCLVHLCPSMPPCSALFCSCSGPAELALIQTDSPSG